MNEWRKGNQSLSSSFSLMNDWRREEIVCFLSPQLSPPLIQKSFDQWRKSKAARATQLNLLFFSLQREKEKKDWFVGGLPRSVSSLGPHSQTQTLLHWLIHFINFINSIAQSIQGRVLFVHSLSSSFAHSLSSSLSCRLSFLGRSHWRCSAHNPPKDKARRAGGVHSLTFAPLNARFTPIHKPQRGPNAFNLNLSFNQSSH